MEQYNLPLITGEKKGIFWMIFMHLRDNLVVARLDIGISRAVR